MSFIKFSKLVHDRYNLLAKGELFVVGTLDENNNLDNRALEKVYIKAFPEGTNPIFKTNTEHECSCCFNFIRNIGNVIAINADGKVSTVWDVAGAPAPYDVVAAALHKAVLEMPIHSLFRSKEKQYGDEVTRSLAEDGGVDTWNHFHGKVLPKHFSPMPDTAKGQYASAVHIF